MGCPSGMLCPLLMPWCICVLHGVCSVAVKPVALRPVFGDALVHLRAAWCVQHGYKAHGSEASVR